MTMMIVGELMNFGAYAFVAAIIVVRFAFVLPRLFEAMFTYTLRPFRLLWVLYRSSFALCYRQYS